MAIPHAQPGEMIDATPLGDALPQSRTTTLAKTDVLEILRLVLPADKTIPPHSTPGPITVQCLEGKVDFMVGDQKRELTPGKLLHLSSGQDHAVHALEPSSLLVTIIRLPG